MHRFAVLLVVGTFACKSKSAPTKSAPDYEQEEKSGGTAIGGKDGRRSETPVPVTVQPEGGGGGGGGGGDAGVSRPLDHSRKPNTDDVGQVVAVGSLDQSLIRKQIKHNIPAVNKCYEDAVAANPALEGAIVTKFTIKPDGSVVDAKASGLDDSLGRCVATVIQKITFPRPKNGDKVTVTYPFQFRLTASDGESRPGSASK